MPPNTTFWRYSALALLLLLLAGATNSCYDISADSSNNQTTAEQQKYYAQKIPVPQLKNSIQRQMMAYWYEMQDNSDLVMYTTITSHKIGRAHV